MFPYFFFVMSSKPLFLALPCNFVGFLSVNNYMEFSFSSMFPCYFITFLNFYFLLFGFILLFVILRFSSFCFPYFLSFFSVFLFFLLSFFFRLIFLFLVCIPISVPLFFILWQLAVYPIFHHHYFKHISRWQYFTFNLFFFYANNFHSSPTLHFTHSKLLNSFFPASITVPIKQNTHVTK